MNGLHCLATDFSNMHYYIDAELYDMHFKYEVAQGNGLVDHRIYMEQLPDKILLHPRTFERLHWKLSASGSFYAFWRYRGIVRCHTNPAVEEKVVHTVKDNPSTSSRVV